jgi:hypothetical protein
MVAAKITNCLFAFGFCPLLLAVGACDVLGNVAGDRHSSVVAVHIAAIHRETSADRKRIIAHDLFYQLDHDPGLASSDDVRALAGLLNDPDVQDEAAMALSALGTSVRPIAPALISMFKKVECERVGLSAAQSIARALKNVDTTVPFSGCNPLLQELVENQGKHFPNENTNDVIIYNENY